MFSGYTWMFLFLLTFYDPHLSGWCEHVKYELLWTNRIVYTSDNHGKNIWGMSWMLWWSFKHQPTKEPWCVCFHSCAFQSLFHDCWCLVQNFRRVFEAGSVVVWVKRLVNHHGLCDRGQTHLALVVQMPVRENKLGKTTIREAFWRQLNLNSSGRQTIGRGFCPGSHWAVPCSEGWKARSKRSLVLCFALIFESMCGTDPRVRWTEIVQLEFIWALS